MRYILLILMLLISNVVYAQGGPGVSNAPGVQLQDEGVNQGRVQILNCTGAGITCTKSGVTGTLNATGGSGSFAITEVEVNFGTVATIWKKFTITDASVSATTKIMCVHSGATPTGKPADESEMDSFTCTGVAGTGTFTMVLHAEEGAVHGNHKMLYTIN